MPKNLVLGLDLGSSSIGWALIGDNDDGDGKFLRLGVRVFLKSLTQVSNSQRRLSEEKSEEQDEQDEGNEAAFGG